MPRQYQPLPWPLRRELGKLGRRRRKAMRLEAEQVALLHPLLEQGQADGYSLAELCRVAGVSRETFYVWRTIASKREVT